MKTTLRIFRILCKLLLLAYVTIVNFVFITVFYALLLSILRHIWPAYIPGVFDKGVIPHLVMTLPYYLLLFSSFIPFLRLTYGCYVEKRDIVL